MRHYTDRGLPKLTGKRPLMPDVIIGPACTYAYTTLCEPSSARLRGMFCCHSIAIPSFACTIERLGHISTVVKAPGC